MGEKGDTPWALLGIAWEMGYLIALPLIGFAFLGRFLDRMFATSPLFLILGIIIAIVLSTVLVVRKTMQVMDTANPPIFCGDSKSANDSSSAKGERVYEEEEEKNISSSRSGGATDSLEDDTARNSE